MSDSLLLDLLPVKRKALEHFGVVIKREIDFEKFHHIEVAE